MNEVEVITKDKNINNAQRKALSELIEKKFISYESEARQKEDELVNKITFELVKKFRIKEMEAEADKYEKMTKNIRERITELGFHQNYSSNTYNISGGKAYPLLEMKIKDRSLVLRNISDIKNGLLEKIWLATTTKEAEKLIKTEIEEN